MRRFGYGKGAISRAVEGAVPLRISPVGARDLWGPVEAVSSVLADMDEAVQYEAALPVKAGAILSSDRHLDGLMIPRKEPRDSLG